MTQPPRVPYGPFFDFIEETPESRARLFEMFENKQIGLLTWDAAPNPYGGSTICLECTDFSKLAVMAAPDFTEETPAPFILRPTVLEDSNLIVTPDHARRLRMGSERPGPLQKCVEGQVIHQCRILPELTEWGGEQLLINFRSRDSWLIRAWGPGEDFVTGKPRAARLDAPFMRARRIFSSPITRL